MSRPSAIEAGQGLCVLAVLVGLFMLLSLPLFLLIAGTLGAILLTIAERVAEPDAKTNRDPETDGA